MQLNVKIMCKATPRSFACALLFAYLTQPTKGLLTEGSVVTADSIMNSGYLGYDNCLQGLVDGKWPTQGYQPSTHCVAHTNATKPNESWFNIDLGSKRVVQTVMIINRENCCLERIIGTDLYVGDNSLPYLNTPCGANPKSSGVYSCDGKIGQYIGLYKNKQELLNISQIRAYSYKANAFRDDPTSYQYLTSTKKSNCPVVTNLVFTNALFSTGIRKMPLVGGNGPAYYNIVFNGQRYVHAVTLAGHADQDFKESKNWFVTLGSQTGPDIIYNTPYGKYMTSNFDRQGKEIRIGAYGQSVGIYRADNVSLAFRWIAIFSTKNDCSGPFDWSSSRQDWQIPINNTEQVVTGLIFATIDDCAVFHDMLVLGDNSALPSYMTYNVYTHFLTINVSSSQSPETITVKACANLNDKVTTTKNECKNTVITFVAVTNPAFALAVQALSFAELTIEFEIEYLGNFIQVELPAINWEPTAAIPTFLFAISDYASWLTVIKVGNKAMLQIDTESFSLGTRNFNVTVTDQVSQKSALVAVKLALYSCYPTGFEINPSPLTLEILQESKLLTLQWDSLHPACGTYSAVVETAFADILKINGKQVVAQAPETEVGIFKPVFTLSRETIINQACQATTTTISLTIKRPIVTTLVLNEPAKIVSAYTIGYQEQKIPLPTYHCLPIGCIFSLDYELKLESKTTDARFASNHNFNQQTTQLPSFIKWNAVTGFSINGDDNHEGWNNYLMRLTAKEKSVSVQNSQFLLEVKTAIDCFTNVGLNVGSSYTREITYEIGSFDQPVIFQYPYALDSLSVNTGIFQICGPVTCVVSQTDAIGSEVSSLPSFVKFDLNSMFLSIYSSDLSKNGTFYLLFDYFLSSFEEGQHLKTLVKLTLAAPNLKKPAIAIAAQAPKTIDIRARLTDEFVDPQINQNSITDINQVGLSRQALDVQKSGRIRLNWDTITQLNLFGQAFQVIYKLLDSATPILVQVTIPSKEESAPQEINQGQQEQLTLDDAFQAYETNKPENLQQTQIEGELTQQPPQAKSILKESLNNDSDFNFFYNHEGLAKDSEDQDTPLKARIHYISQTGLVSVQFNQRIKFPDQFVDVVNFFSSQQRRLSIEPLEIERGGRILSFVEKFKEKPLLKLRMFTREFDTEIQSEELLSYYWNVTSVDQDASKFNIQVTFTNPLEVSATSQPEFIQLDFNYPEYFRSIQGKTLETKKALKAIPPQWQNEKIAAAFNRMTKVSSNILTGAVASSFSVMWFLQLSLAMLWGLINFIQMIVVLPLVQVIYPSNALTLNSALLTLANFEILPCEKIDKKVFKFGSLVPLSDSFNRYGFNSMFMVLNMGTSFYIFFGSIIVLPIVKGIGYYIDKKYGEDRPKIRKYYQMLKSKLEYGYYIQMVFELYLDLAITSFVNLYCIKQSFDSLKLTGNMLSGLFTVIGTIMVAFIPLYISNVLLKNRDHLESPEFEKKFGLLTFETKNDRYLNGLVFIIRRLFTALILVCLKDQGYFQIIFLAYLQSAYIIYLGLAEPLKEKADNQRDLIQEVATMFCIYHLFIFTDWVSTVSASASQNAGWTQIIVVIFIIILGVFRMVWQTVKALLAKWRQIKYRKMKKLVLQRRLDSITKQAALFALQEDLRLESIESEQNSSQEPKKLLNASELAGLNDREALQARNLEQKVQANDDQKIQSDDEDDARKSDQQGSPSAAQADNQPSNQEQEESELEQTRTYLRDLFSKNKTNYKQEESESDSPRLQLKDLFREERTGPPSLSDKEGWKEYIEARIVPFKKQDPIEKWEAYYKRKYLTVQTMVEGNKKVKPDVLTSCSSPQAIAQRNIKGKRFGYL